MGGNSDTGDSAFPYQPATHADLPDSIPIAPASPGYAAKIVIDKREMRCAVSKEIDRIRFDLETGKLYSLPRGSVPDARTSSGVELDFHTLSIADYVLSDRVGVERKATDDLLKTFLERRELFSQLRDLKMAYKRPLLIIEGEGGQNALFTSRMIDPAAMNGVLDAITIGFGIPIYYTMDCTETAQVLARIAIHQQNREKRPISLHGKRSHMSRREIQEYVISSIPDIGPKAAERLLAHFGSIEGIVNAPREELLKVNKVGPKTADMIRGLVSAEYKSQSEAK